MSFLPPIPPMGPPPPDMGDGLNPPPMVMAGADQPIEVRLAPTQPLHGKVVQKLKARLDLSSRNIKSRYEAWDRVDEHMRLFTDLSRPIRKGDNTTDSTKGRENPFDRAIVIPMSYAIHEVRKTELFSLFGRREPFMQLQGRSPDDIRPAKTLEALMDYDFNMSNGGVAIYSMIQDADKYGLGVIFDHWEDKSGWKTVMQPPELNPMQSIAVKMGLMPPPPPVPTKQWGTTREYNKQTPVDPFNFWPDPRVSIANLQEGEFIGHRVYRGLMHLMERDSASGGPYFNLDKLKQGNASGTQGETARTVGRTRFALDQFALREMGDDKDKGYYTLDHLQVKLIPKDWELADSDKPEIWWFTLADERTIIRAHKSAYEHNEFSYSVAEINPDPHTIANPGVIEMLDGLQRTSNWLLNSNIENVRKFINNELIYDPDLLEENDVENPGPARWIRLTQEGSERLRQGVPIGSMYAQLQVADVTAGHHKLIEILYDMAQRMSAASDQAQSQLSPSGTTLGEIKMLNAGANSRLAVTARLIDAMAISPLAKRAIANRQQFTSIEQYVRIVGDLAKETQGLQRMLVKPSDIEGDFDYVPHSAAAQDDPERMAQTWQQLLQTVGAFPQITQPGPDGKYLDVREVFNETARSMGVRDIETFYQMMPMPPPMMPGDPNAPQVVPDQQVQQQVQAGNMVPVQ